jgi:hypothetical protein
MITSTVAAAIIHPLSADTSTTRLAFMVRQASGCLWRPTIFFNPVAKLANVNLMFCKNLLLHQVFPFSSFKIQSRDGAICDDI